ncbi:MAG TPA: DUF3604 domain-containing protein [Acidimicrobiia bacterium]|nr:DUF3604 domain-containing protein [Acidimicrobiia bacterium]
MAHCSHPEHQLEAYSDEHRQLLADIARLNNRLLDAHRDGRRLDSVIATIDPDPARYMFVDEGRGTLRRQLIQADEALAAAGTIAGHSRLTATTVPDATSATRPTVAISRTGEPVIGWIEWIEDVGEHVMAAIGATTYRLDPSPADCFRPTAIVGADGNPWMFYGMAVENEVRVFCRRFDGEEWSGREAVSDTAHPSFNQEVAVHTDGSIEVTWQGRVGERFGIFARRWRPDTGWDGTVGIDGATSSNVWDPAIAALPGAAAVHVWCGYHEGGYRIQYRLRNDDGLGPVHTIVQASGQGLHPSVATDAGGRIWCAFDVFDVAHHGGSGPTQLRAAGRVGEDFGWPGLGDPGLFMPPELVPPIATTLRVVEITPDGVADAPGVVAEGLHLGPSAYPRLAVESGGAVALSYRILRRLSMMTYHWEVAVQRLSADGWDPPSTLEPSDGGLEEPAIAAGTNDVVVAWTSDGRASINASWADGFGGLECPDLREHYGEVVWHGIHDAGRINWVRMPAGAAPAGPRHSSATVPAGIVGGARRNESRYRTTVNGEELTLYWGDLHRHSLISRCTSGDEPSVDDMYRYAWDVSDYDFWALTDHSENSTAYQWWTIQKAADLFHIPGRFVPLYGFEWTSPHTGHQNVIFDSARRGAPIVSSMAADSDTPDKLWRHLRRFGSYPSITIPHHPGSAMVPFDWDYRDDEMVRVVEIFQSCRGSYERDGGFRQYSDATLPGTFVFDALDRGHRFGLIGSSDHGYGTGYVGAFAPDLGRDSVFASLLGRRTIAATRRGIVVDARIGNTFMGGETTVAEAAPVEFTVHASGYRDIARVEIVKNGATVESVGPDLDLADGWVEAHIRVEWGWGPGTTDWSGSLVIDGGEVCQTDFWSPEVTGFDKSEVRWRAVTTSFGEPYGHQRGGIELTLVGPRAALVRVETTAGRIVARLGTIVDAGIVEGIVRGEGRLMIQPGVGGLTSLGTPTIDVIHHDETATPGWYVARVILVDGEMAWSSPVWVDG